MILCLDPGKDNFAYAVVSKKKLVATGMFSNTINSFTEKDKHNKVKAFSKEIVRLLDKYKVTDVVAERYLVRAGQSKTGASCEFISFSLGYIERLCKERKIELHLITPSVWKQFCIRTFKEKPQTPLTETFGFFNLSKNFSNVPIREHQFDAMGISLYWFSKSDVDVFKLRKRICKKLVKIWRENEPTEKRLLRSYSKVKIKIPK
jgi:Holliday junction resolvasome RuvABC endonuclease subunit